MLARLIWFAVFAMMIVSGCEDQCNDCDWKPDQEIGSIEVSFGYSEDTLDMTGVGEVLPFIVMVRNRDGTPLPGIKTYLSLSNPNFGVVEYTNPNLGDTTNSNGVVLCVFRTYGQFGTQSIRASAGQYTDIQTIAIHDYSGSVNALSLLATPSILEADNDGIALSTISATVVNEFNQGIPGRTVEFTVNGGELTEAPPTDSNGRTQCYWIADHLCGEYMVSARAGSIADSVRITVSCNPGVPYFYVSTATTFVEADSSEEVEVLVAAVLRNSVYEGVPDALILVSTTGGTVPQSLHTNGAGVCTFVWQFADEFGIFRLFAEYEPWALRDTLLIEIRHTP
ncbi:MAG: Ig-like domain-containing protein [Calditrichaeota bacterium]|nr:Ig-like domain-containing protein [Calditrichota bacterium]MCB9369772.1 Ig-like domain-containing protein [Calditrichota bacterium]